MNIKIVSKLVLLTQVLFPLCISANSVASAIDLNTEDARNRAVLARIKSSLPELNSSQNNNTDSKVSSEDILAAGLSQSGTILTSDNPNDAAKSFLQNSAYGFLGSQMQSWLNQFGNSRVQIGSKESFSAELLLPLFEDDSNLIFSQSRISREDEYRKTLNIGIGYRHFLENWMWGANSFYDRDLKNSNARLGAGFELGADYVKLSTNGYFRLTDWRQSKVDNFIDYYERPANGFDVRAEGYIPSYPKVGFNAKYEKYFGKNVNLKGSTSLSDLKDDPEAYTVGVSYTPVPLFSFKLNQSMGDVNETKGTFELNYRLGVSLDQQLDEKFVDDMRTLRGSRYDFVDRNNAIVMQYKKQELLRIALPKSIEVQAGSQEDLNLSITKNKYPIDHIEWLAPLFLAKGGTLTPTSTAPYSVAISPTFYDYDNLDTNTYDLTATAVDKNGNRSNTVTTQIVVTAKPVDEAIAGFETQKDKAVAKTDDSIDATIAIINSHDKTPLQDVEVNFEISSDTADVTGISLDDKNEIAITKKTGSDGKATVKVNSTKAGDFILTARIASSRLSREIRTETIPITFTADKETATIKKSDLTVEGDSPVANGTNEVKVKVKVTDANGNPVPEVDVLFSADHNATIETEAKTDADGYAIVSLKNKTAGVTTVTATVGEAVMTTEVEFLADNTTAVIAKDALSIGTNDKEADGKTANSVKVKVVDAEGNVVSGATVYFKANNNAVIAESAETDDDGLLEMPVTLLSGNAQDVVVSASLDKEFTEGKVQQVTLHFTANSSAKVDPDNINIDGNGAIANGEDPVSIDIKVIDADGKPLPNQEVTFVDENGDVIGTGTTDANGNVTIDVVSDKAGTKTITPKFGDKAGESIDISFVADESTAQLALAVEDKTPAANSSDTNTVTVTVTDANGNAISGYTVYFKADDGATIDTSAITNAQGVATAKLTSSVATVIKVTASNKADFTGDNVLDKNVTFIADSETATLAKDALSIGTNDKEADGKTANSVKVKVVDAKGNVVSGATVYFKANNNAVIAESAETDDDGLLEMPVTLLSGNAQDVVVSASLDKEFTEGKVQQVTLHFTANSSAKVDPDNINIDGNGAIANGEDPVSIDIKVIDADGKPLPNQEVTFVDENGDVIGTGTTDANGNVTIDVVSDKAGTKTITPKFGDKAGESIDISFVADESTAQLALAVEDKTPAANSSDTNTVTVTVTDANGNAISGYTVYFKADDGATIDTSAITNAQGVATAKLTSSVATVIKVTASNKADFTGDNVLDKNVTFIADSETATLAKDALSIGTNDKEADGKTANSVKVKVVDAKGNVVSGATVYFKANNNAVIAESAETDDDGLLEMPVTLLSGNAQDVVVSASLDKEFTEGKVQQVTLHFTANSSAKVDPDNINIDGNGAIANGEDPVSIDIKVIDADGKPLPNQEVTFVDENGDVIGTGTTDANGNVTIDVVSDKAGTKTITPKFGDKAGESIDISFVADESTAQLALAVEDKTPAANSSDTNTVTVTVTDANGNAISGYTVYFKADDGATIDTSAITNAQGVATAKLTSSVATVIKVTASNKADFTGDNVLDKNVTFIADSETATLAKDALSIGTNDKEADGKTANSVKVKVVDAKGNVVSGATVYFKANNNAVIAESAETDDDGLLEMPVTLLSGNAQDVVVSASLDKEFTEGKVQQVTLHFTANSSAKVDPDNINIDGNGAIANGEDPVSIDIKVIDADGKPLPNQEVTFVDENGDVIGTGTTDANGNVTIDVVSDKAGTKTITPKFGDKAGESIDISFVADESTAQLALAVEDKTPAANSSDTNTVTVTVTDANGNAISGYTVYFKADDGATIDTSAITNAQGVATAKLTSSVATVIKVTASNKADFTGDNVLDKNVTFIADSETATLAKDALSIGTNDKEADGKTANSVKVKVVDAKGNVVSGATVYFKANNNAVIAESAETDDDGLLEMPVTLLSGNAQDVVVSASLDKEFTEGKVQQVTLHFTANSSAKVDPDNINIDGNGAIANGEDPVSIDIKVIDADGKPLPNQEVTFVDENGDVIGTGTTDANGNVTIDVVSDKAGTKTITPKFGDKAGESIDISFVADESTAQLALAVEDKTPAANSSDTNTVTVTVTDANGNAISGYTVYFKADDGATIDTSAITNAQGVATAKLTSSVATVIKVTASNKADFTGDNVLDKNVTFIADSETATLAKDALSIGTNDKEADGKTANSVKVKVVDAKGNVVSGATVYFKANNNAVIAESAETDDDGLLEMPVTLLSGNAQDVVVSASLDKEFTEGKVQQVTLHFTANSSAKVDPDNINIDGNGAIANGEDPVSIDIKVIDADGKPLPNQEVTFVDENGDVIGTGTTDANGNVTIDVVSDKAGTKTITPKFGDKAGESIDISFVADESTAQLALAVEDKTPAANSSDTNTVTVTVTDANGNAISGYTVYFKADDGATIDTSAITNAQGVATAKLTSSVATVIKVTASNKADFTGDNVLDKNVTFIADSETATLAKDALSIGTNDKEADGKTANSVKVKVVDAKGNVVSGATVYFKANNNAVIAESAETDDDGLLEMPVTLLSGNAQDVVVSASLDKEFTEGKVQQVTLHFTANSSAKVDPDNINIDGNGAIANGEDPVSIDIKVIDADGKPLPNQEVTFVDENGDVIGTGTTDANGNVTIDVVSDKAGTKTITPKFGDKAGESIDISFVADESTAQLALAVEDKTPAANSSDTNTVTVTVTDANGNAISGYTVYFKADDGATIDTSAITNAQGVATAKLTSSVATVIKVTASNKADFTGDNVLDKNVTFIGDKATAVIDTVDVKITGTTNANIALADGKTPVTITVNVIDANGYVIPNADISFEADNGAVVQNTAVTDTNGQAVVELTNTTSGVTSLTVKTGESEKTVTINFAADYNTAKIAGALIVTTNDSIADGATHNEVEVKVTDENGNALSGYLVGLETNGEKNTIVIDSNIQVDENGKGVIKLTSSKAQVVTVTASITNTNGEKTSESVDVTFVANEKTAQIAAGNLSIVTDGQLADGNEVNSVKVLVTDEKGNTLKDQDVELSFDNDSAVIVSTTTNSSGETIFTFKSTKSGTTKVTASVTRESGETSSQTINVVFRADSKTAKIVSGNLTVNKTRAVIGGDKNSVKVRLVDANSNPIAGMLVGVEADNGAVVGTINLTDDNGESIIPLTNDNLGDTKVTASITNANGQTTSLSVEVEFVAQITANNIYVTQNEALADGDHINKFKLKVTDYANKGIAGQVVSLKTDAEDRVTMVSSVTTDSNGEAEVEIKSTKSNYITVTATIFDSSVTATPYFSADQSTAQVIVGSLAVASNNAPADGKTANVIQVTIYDAMKNPLSGKVIGLTANNGTEVGNIPATDSDGIALINLTNTTATTSKVIASITSEKGIETKQSIDVTFKPDTNSAALVMTATKQSADANGSDTASIEIVATDANGNIVPDLLVPLTIPSEVTVKTVNGSAYSSADQFVTNSNGKIVITMASSTLGDYTIKANVNNSTVSTSISFVITIDASLTTVTLDKSRIVNNGNAEGSTGGAATVTIKLVDSNGAAVTGMAGNIAILSSKNGLLVSVSEDSVTKGTYTAILSSKVANTYDITLSFNNGIAYTKTLDALTVYTYNIAMNTTSHSMGAKMQYQLSLVGTESDTGNSVSLDNLSIAWTSSNGSVATVVDGLVTGMAAGSAVITATPTSSVNGVALSSSASTNFSISALTYSSIYGDSTSKPSSSTEFIIEPPEYKLIGRGSWVVDGLGDGNYIVGGSGGEKYDMTNVDQLKSVQVVICTFNGVTAIGQLLFTKIDGSQATVGEAHQNDCAITSKPLYTVPTGQKFVGMVGWESATYTNKSNGKQEVYLGGIQFISADK